MSVPWVEKYRPKSVEDLSHQDDAKALLQQAVQTGQLPHLLFYGPPGTGKTSAALALCQQMFGSIWKDRVHEFNASDDRGIAFVRDKVKTCAEQTVPHRDARCPLIKVIILDEADVMTVDAQSALRRTMETYSKSTRFIIICNYISKIMDPITSRCAKFRFSPLPDGTIQSRLEHIAEQEGLSIEEGALSAIMHAVNGDMRRAVAMLQNVASLQEGNVTKEGISRCSIVIPEPFVVSLLESCLGGTFAQVQSQVDSLLKQGYAGAQAMLQLSSMLVSGGKSAALDDAVKGRCLLKIAECEGRLCDGGSDWIQLMDCCATMQRLCRTSS